MATLADAGSKQTNENNPFPYANPATSENNPYQQALQGNYNDKIFAGVTAKQPTPNATSDPNALQVSGENGYNAATLAPAGLAYQKAQAKGDTSTVAQILAGKNLPVTADDSVKGTPEAASPADAAAQQAQANVRQIKTDEKSKTGYGKLNTPTRQAEVNAALAPDQAALASLPAEYQKTLSQLAPYANLGENTGNAALNAADTAVNSAVGQSNNIVEAALKQLPTDSSEYAKSVTTQPIIQALLGFGKYEQTYAGAQPTGQSQWSQSMDEIYKYLSGANASSVGLPGPTTAAATASTGPGVPGATGAGGGNG